MPLTRTRGNMYDWVTHTHAHLGGECPHRCSYCYVDSPRFGRPARYQGALRLIWAELSVRYGAGKTIFIDHMNDLWAREIPARWIGLVLDHCACWPKNTYVFQTKNPSRYVDFWADMPRNRMLGCTIETNRDIPASVSVAPAPGLRAVEMMGLPGPRFVTVEPIMDFDVPELGQWLIEIRPDWVNVGADSKGKGLPEPSAEKVLAMLDVLAGAGIPVKRKANLSRLLGIEWRP